MPDFDTIQRVTDVLSEHRHPGELLTVLGDAWMTCGCGAKIDLPVKEGRVSRLHANRLFEAHQAQAIAEAGLLRPEVSPIRLGSCCISVGTDACKCERPTNWGLPESRCPGCGEVKFVGHGPLCLDCFGLATRPADGSPS